MTEQPESLWIENRDELLEELERARTLLRLITVRQVIESDLKTINAAGLNPYCINEGRATGNDRIDTSFMDDIFAFVREK